MRAIWLLVAAVALVQVGIVRLVGATRWKLGGFGMYSEAHPNQRMVVVRGRAGVVLAPPPVACQGHAERLRRLPSEGAARALLSCLPAEAERVEVWTPGVDPDTGQLTVREVAGHGR